MTVCKKTVGMLLVLAVFVCLLTGCGNGMPEQIETLTVTDALDRTVTLPMQPKRVACLIGSFAEVWMLAGGEVVATADDAWDDFGLEIDAVNLGKTKSPDVERLFAANPDLVIASASTAANVEMLGVLEDAGIPTVYFEVAGFADYLAMLDVCTDLTGRKDLYRINGLELQKQIDAVKADPDWVKLPKEQRTVLFLRASAGYVRAKNSQGSVLGEMLADLGMINIADKDGSLLEDLSMEAIYRADPYRIFFVQVGDDADGAREQAEQTLYSDPVWQQLAAVQNDRVYWMDKRLFNLKPNARWGEAYEILAKILLS